MPSDATPPPRKPRISASDRLGFTLFLALVLHLVFILGVGFSPSDAQSPESLPNLDIILANTESPEAPEQADFLAQSNQKGGGNQEDKARPSAPVSADSPINRMGLDERQQRQRRASEVRIEHIYYINQREAEQQIDRAKRSEKAQQQQQSEDRINQQQREIASLQAEIRKMVEAYARRPREIVLTANTREAVEAGYLAQWVSRIEHIGNLNYPPQAEVNRIDGSLRLNVRINAQGKVIDARISRSSGERILDEAALRIVRLAEPFAEFPPKLKEKADQIVIIRTWEFDSSKAQRLSTTGAKR